MNSYSQLIEILNKPKILLTKAEIEQIADLFGAIDEIKDKAAQKGTRKMLLKCAENAELKAYSKGHELTVQGDEILFFGIVIQGEVGVYRRKNTAELSQSRNFSKHIPHSNEDSPERTEGHKIKQANHMAKPHLRPVGSAHRGGHSNLNINVLKKNWMKMMDNQNKMAEINSGTTNVTNVLTVWENSLYSIDHLREKYFYDLNCSLKYLDTYLEGDSIHSKGMFQNLKSGYTYICLTDCQVLEISKTDFSSIYADIITLFGKKIDFIKEFFGYPSEDSLNKLLRALQEIDFRIGDQIYKEGQRSNGLYFIIEGEVKLTKIATLNEADEKPPDHNELFLRQLQKREIDVRFMTAKEFFGEEEFFGDHKRKHNARAASHHVLALFLPSNDVATVKGVNPLTIDKMVKIARQRNKHIYAESFEEKVNLINPPLKIPDNPLIEKFYDTEIKQNIKNKSQTINNSYFKYYRNEHKIHVKEAEKKDISFEDLLSNKLYFRIRNTKHSRKKEYFRKVVDILVENEENQHHGSDYKRLSPVQAALKKYKSESKILMTETSIDYSPQHSNRENFAKTNEMWWKKANVQAILENAAVNDYFFPKPIQSSRDHQSNSQKFTTTGTTLPSFRNEKKKLMASYSNLLNSSRRFSTEPKSVSDLKISDILRSTPVKLQELQTQTISESKVRAKMNSETQTYTTPMRPQTQPPLQRKTRTQEVQTQGDEIKPKPQAQDLSPIPYTIKNTQPRSSSASPDRKDDLNRSQNASKNNNGNSRVMVRSRHNQFRLKPKDRLVLTERYLI